MPSFFSAIRILLISNEITKALHITMKHTLLLALLFLSSNINALDAELSDFILGEYILIGKGLDSDSTYSGKVKIYMEDGEFKMSRQIGKVKIVGTAAIEKTAHGDAEVLRLRFTESSQLFEQTCLVQSDLDNYARISCYLYKPREDTNMPGMEVLFHDHNTK